MLAGLKKKILNIWETHMIKKETPEKEAWKCIESKV